MSHSLSSGRINLLNILVALSQLEPSFEPKYINLVFTADTNDYSLVTSLMHNKDAHKCARITLNTSWRFDGAWK